jgi:shikimate 5-dehydrogenase
MLLHQAVEQIRIWSGRHADPALLRRAALEAL